MPTSHKAEENQQWRNLFNQEFFGTDFTDKNESFSLRTTDEDRRKSNYSYFDYQNLIQTIESYCFQDKKLKDNYISNSRTYGYKASKTYYIQSYPSFESDEESTSFPSSSNSSKLIVRRDTNKRLIPAPEVFDVILRYHLQAGHKKSASTYNLISEHNCNITFSMVKFFIEHCPTCLKHEKDKHKKKKEKGPAKAIISSGFRDRIQMDLVNYERDPQFDINGVLMRYLLVLKDHFTKFVWLRAIQHKDAKYVHHTLRCLFHEIGFPLILHSDNGTEFVNQLIESFIREESNSNTFMVNGAPRTPRVQGSVENMNYHVQQCIEKTKDILRTEDNPNPSWLECLPLTTSAINTTACLGVHKLNPYRHVYTIDHKLDIHFPNKHARAYASQSPQNFHKYIADPILKAKIEAILLADQQSISSVASSLPPSYIELPIEGNLKDDKEPTNCPQVQLSNDTDSISHNSTIVLKEIQNPFKDYDWSNVNPNGSTHDIARTYFVSQRAIRMGYKEMIPSYSAVPFLGKEYSLSFCDKSFKIIKAYLDDQHLLQNHNHLIDPVDHLLIGEPQYYEYCKSTPDRWWENWLVETFFIMAMISSTSTNKKDIAYLRIPSVNTPEVPAKTTNIHQNIEKVISFAWKNHHYATIVYDLTEDTIDVFDGLANDKPSHARSIWSSHITYIHSRCNNQSHTQLSNAKIRFPTTIGGLEFKQSDPFNCGPIACYVMWYFMNSLEAAQSVDTLSDGSVRNAIIEKLLQWFQMKEEVLRSPSQFISLTEYHNTQTNKNEIIIPDDDITEIQTSVDYEDELLKQHCEQILLVSQYDQMRHSKKKKDTGSILRRRQNILSSTIIVGDVVSLHVHKKDRFDKIGKNVMAVVFEISKEEAIGIKAITEHGIIGWKNGDKDRWIGMEHFHATGTDLYLPPILAKYRSLILDRKFVPDLIKRITIQAAYKKTFPPPAKCNCKDNCISNCQCRLKGKGCSKECKCKGKCSSHERNLVPFDKAWVDMTLSNAISDFQKKSKKFSPANYRFDGNISDIIDNGVNTIIAEVISNAKVLNENESVDDTFASPTKCIESDNDITLDISPEPLLSPLNSVDYRHSHELEVISQEGSSMNKVKTTSPTHSQKIERNVNVKLLLSTGIIKVRDTGLFHKTNRETSINGIVRHVVDDEDKFGFSVEIDSGVPSTQTTIQSFTSKSFFDVVDSFYYRVYGHWKRLEIQLDEQRYTISRQHLVPTVEEVPTSELVDFGEEAQPDDFDIWFEKSQEARKKSMEKQDEFESSIRQWNDDEEKIRSRSKRKAESMKSLQDVLRESDSSDSISTSSQFEATTENEKVEPRRSKRNQTKVTSEPRRSTRRKKPNKRYM